MKKQKLLNKPGVYVFWRNGERIYIGSSANVSKRSAKRDKGHASRWAAILASTRTEIIPCESTLKANQLEERLIRKFKPRFNLRTPRAQEDLARTWQLIQDNW